MSTDKYGDLVRALADVPCDMHGIIGEILARARGEERLYWKRVWERANLRKNPFESRINLVDLRVIPEASHIIYDVSKKNAEKNAGFSTVMEDPSSPFFGLDLMQPLAKSRPTKKLLVQGYNLQMKLSFSKLVSAAGGSDEVCSKHILTPAQIRKLVELQKGGEKGVLSVSGDANLFFVDSLDNSIALVRVFYNPQNHVWKVWSYPNWHSNTWPWDTRLFLRAA